MTTLLVYAEAYAIKESLGGGYRGFAKDRLSGEIRRSEVRPTMEAARNDAKRFAGELLAGRPYRPGYYRPTRTQWSCNYWSAQ